MDNRDYFYKYYDINAGILTLQNVSRKWANPKTFNDVFDNQFNIRIKGNEDNLQNQGLNFLLDLVLNDKPIPKRLALESQMMLQCIKSVSKKDFEKIIHKLRNSSNVYPSGFVKNDQKKFNDGLKEIMDDVSIFCLTEDKDNLLMWAHYAGNHTGIVIKFKDVPEFDTPIKLAQKVIYVDTFPEISYDDIFNDKYTEREIHDIFSLTKGKDWKYEKEWRIVSGLRDKSKPYEIIPFAKEEVKAVYLGCKISDENKRTVIDIIKYKYPWAEIYQTKKSNNEYKLLFDKI